MTFFIANEEVLIFFASRLLNSKLTLESRSHKASIKSSQKLGNRSPRTAFKSPLILSKPKKSYRKSYRKRNDRSLNDALEFAERAKNDMNVLFEGIKIVEKASENASRPVLDGSLPEINRRNWTRSITVNWIAVRPVITARKSRLKIRARKNLPRKLAKPRRFLPLMKVLDIYLSVELHLQKKNLRTNSL